MRLEDVVMLAVLLLVILFFAGPNDGLRRRTRR